MFTYLKMKRNEWKVKAILYGAIDALINNQKELLVLLREMYTALKDVPAEELQREFVNKLAEIIHEENIDKND